MKSTWFSHFTIYFNICSQVHKLLSCFLKNREKNSWSPVVTNLMYVVPMKSILYFGIYIFKGIDMFDILYSMFNQLESWKKWTDNFFQSV